LGRPQFRGVFNFIQEFQGYISPGILAAFLVGFVVKRAPAAAGVVAIPLSALIYGVLHLLCGGYQTAIYELHFLMRMLLMFLTVVAAMLVMTVVAPRPEPAKIPVRDDVHMTTSPLAMVLGAVMILAVVAFYAVLW